jgi:hypothetical protein
MTPGIINPDDFPIYQGAKWSFVFALTQTSTGIPIDLTGLGPFVFELKRMTSDEPLVTGTAEVDPDPETGLITLTLTAAQTDALALGKVRLGLRDALNNPYMVGELNVKYFPPEPA